MLARKGQEAQKETQEDQVKHSFRPNFVVAYFREDRQTTSQKI